MNKIIKLKSGDWVNIERLLLKSSDKDVKRVTGMTRAEAAKKYEVEIPKKEQSKPQPKEVKKEDNTKKEEGK